MSVYRATVGQDFLTMIQPKIDGDTRGKEVAKRQWSFEFIEYALGKIPASGHTWYDGMDRDTEHDYFGKCDFKYHNKEGVIRLSPYVMQQIEKKNIDTFITWKYLDRNPMEALSLNESVKFELIMYIDAQTVYNGANWNEEVGKYEYFYS